MSGGDLDGDVYMCIWDKELVTAFKKENVEPPAQYGKFPDNKIVKSDHIVDHMKVYFEKDNLGQLAHLH